MSANSITRTALVTGAAKRVGRAIALRLAFAGFDVAITYLSSEDDARRVVDEIRQLGRRAEAVKADLTQPQAAVKAIVDCVERKFGQLHVLVNNASIYEPASLADTTLDL